MMQAVKRFNPDRGFRLATYAMWWIRAAIQEYILHSWSLVKIGTTAAQKKLFFSLRKLKSQLQAIDGGRLSSDRVTIIAKTLNVTEGEVIDMNQRLSGPDYSLNSVRPGCESGEWQDLLPDQTESVENRLAERDETNKRRKLLIQAMDQLNDRERRIITERKLRDIPLTLEELSQSYGISRERIRQIEAKAYEKVRSFIISAAMDARLISCSA